MTETMKRNIYLILALLFMGTVQVSAQQLGVLLNDGDEVKFDEYMNIATAKITFSNGQLLFHVGNTVKSTIDIKEIDRLFFYGVQGNVDTMPGEELATYSAARQELTVNAQPGTTVNVYHANGARVLTYVQTIAATPISVAHLPAGVYVVVVGSENLKFVKQ